MQLKIDKVATYYGVLPPKYAVFEKNWFGFWVRYDDMAFVTFQEAKVHAFGIKVLGE